MKLYKPKEAPDPAVWIGEDKHGAVMTWPVEPGGWAKRTAYVGSRRQLLEVEPALARGTGWPGAGRARRPRAPDGKASTHQLAIRSTLDELKAWTRRAEEEGKATSAWGRDILNAEIARTGSKPKP